jgi:hypothetical protein
MACVIEHAQRVIYSGLCDTKSMQGAGAQICGSNATCGHCLHGSETLFEPETQTHRYGYTNVPEQRTSEAL